MAKPTDFEGSNMVLTSPDSDVGDLPCLYDAEAQTHTTCWRLSSREIADVLQSGVIVLRMHMGGWPHPPVNIDALPPKETKGNQGRHGDG